jgi:hypothetical protein
MVQARINYGHGAPSGHRRKGQREIPVGYPFSYLAQFHNTGGQHLIDHPYRRWDKRFLEHLSFLLRHHKLVKEIRNTFHRWLRRLVDH